MFSIEIFEISLTPWTVQRVFNFCGKRPWGNWPEMTVGYSLLVNSGRDRESSACPYFTIVRDESENMQKYSMFVYICVQMKKREKRYFNSQLYISMNGISYALNLCTS